MPLREDLLTPIEGESPSGPDLRYDKVFDQIKEARTEDDDSIPSGDWARSPKKADRVLVIKLAGETLATRSKDLRLAGWYLESLVRREGFSQLPGGLDFLLQLQTGFWATFHPELEEDGNADLRIGAMETAANLLAQAAKAVPLTRDGVNWLRYQDARAIGVDTGELSSEKAAARAEAIAAGQLTGEDLQRSVDATPKAFYVETDTLLERSLENLALLDEFQQERYGDDYPSMGRLRSSLEDVKKVVSAVLTEKRKSDPDVVETGAENEEPELESDHFARFDEVAESKEPSAEPEEETPVATKAAVLKRRVPAGVPTDEAGAYAQVAAAAEFLRQQSKESVVPYLLCSALRLGEARVADLNDGTFAVAPATTTRQTLRRLASEASWDELMQLCLATMTEPCGRVWLDLQRYTWRAASEQGQNGIARAVVNAVASLLAEKPELRTLVLDDDTPAANAETLQWLDSEVIPPAPEPVIQYVEREPEPAAASPIYAPMHVPDAPSAADIYDTALAVLKRGEAAEAISMLVRDSELQPSGRMRFHRRVQMAQLCLAADQAAVAYPVLLDLSNEMERRALDTWESAEMLAQPLSLLLRCLDLRKGSEEQREMIFSRLCRLDPQAAIMVKR